MEQRERSSRPVDDAGQWHVAYRIAISNKEYLLVVMSDSLCRFL